MANPIRHPKGTRANRNERRAKKEHPWDVRLNDKHECGVEGSRDCHAHSKEKMSDQTKGERGRKGKLSDKAVERKG